VTDVPNGEQRFLCFPLRADVVHEDNIGVSFEAEVN